MTETAIESTAELWEYFRRTGPYGCGIFGLCPNTATQLTDQGVLGIIAGCERCMTKMGYDPLPETDDKKESDT